MKKNKKDDIKNDEREDLKIKSESKKKEELLKRKRKKEEENKGKIYEINTEEAPKKKEGNIKFEIDKLNLNKKRKILLSFTTILNKLNELIKTEPKNKEDFQKIFTLSDLNSKINFLYLKFLETNDKNKYSIFITKYKYTIEFQHYKKLKCLKEDDYKEIDKLNSFRESNGISKINEINSLSKVKLINFIYQIHNYFKNTKSKEDIQKLILNYQINVDLKFKLPNNYGCYELKYYTFLQLFIALFDIFDKNDDINKGLLKKTEINEENKKNEELYFDSFKYDESDYEKYNCNEKEVIKDIKSFNDYINSLTYKFKEVNFDIILQKSTRIKKRFNLINLLKGLDLFKRYIKKDFLLIETDDEKYIKKIEFLYFSMIYFNNSKLIEYNNNVEFYINDEPDKYKNAYLEYCTNIDKEFINKFQDKENLIYSKIINFSDIPLKDLVTNPLNNMSNYYHFPLNIKKSIFTFEDNFFISLKNFFYEVYQSRVMKDIFYLTEEFKEFYYPFCGKEKELIFKELFDATEFYPFPYDGLCGYTCKILPKIIISSSLKNNSSMEKIIIDFSKIINTVFHEQFKHLVKTIIHYNTLRLNLFQPLESEERLDSQNFQNFLKIVKKKKEEINYKFISEHELEEIVLSDGGIN